jgi:hypothetical protein
MPASERAARAVQTYVLFGNPCRTGVDMFLSYLRGRKLLFATRLCFPTLVVMVGDQNSTGMEDAV